MNRKRGEIIPLYHAEYNAFLQLGTLHIIATIVLAIREAKRNGLI